MEPEFVPLGNGELLSHSWQCVPGVPCGLSDVCPPQYQEGSGADGGSQLSEDLPCKTRGSDSPPAFSEAGRPHPHHVAARCPWV